MKRIVVLFTIFALNSIMLDAQEYTLFDNFDDTGKVYWLFHDGWAGGSINHDTLNPLKSGINVSEKVAKLVEAGEATKEGLAYFFLQKPFDLSVNNQFRMKVYGEAGLEVSLSLWRNEMNNWGYYTAQSREYTITETNTWEEAIFDFSNVSDSTRYDKVVIYLNKGVIGNAELYFDDVEGPLYTDTAIPLFALTSYYGEMVEIKCSNYITLPDNSIDDFELKVNNQLVSIDSIYLKPDFTKIIVLNPHDSILEGDEVTCSYSGTTIYSREGWQLKAFDSLTVANGVGKREVLVWSDEFNEGELDTSIWKRMDSDYWYNEEVQSYTPNDTNSFIQDSALHLVAYEQNRGVRNYTSARLETRYKMSFRYGRIEAGLQTSTGSGYWPAFWMMPVEDEYGEWPNSGEIDIMEYFGSQSSIMYPRGGGVHFWNYSENWRDHEGGGYGRASKPLNTDFSTYNMKWIKDSIIFDIEKYNYSKVSANKVGLNNWPFDKDFYIILNLAISPRYGDPSRNTYPQSLLVDFVRIYKFPSGQPPYSEPSIDNSLLSNRDNENCIIYPNPTKGTIHIETNPIFQLKRFTIFDLNGKLVKQGVTESDTIDLSELPSDLYLIKLETSDGVFKRIILLE